jgi:hypothetical protein
MDAVVFIVGVEFPQNDYGCVQSSWATMITDQPVIKEIAA